MLRTMTIGLLSVPLVVGGIVEVMTHSPSGPSVARIAVRQAALDPPALWRAEVIGGAGGPPAALDVCTDASMRQGFTRPKPQVNGEPCLGVGLAVNRPGLHAVRCVAYGRRYSVNATTAGDMARDFTVALAMRPLEVDYPAARQAVRYRRLGACPRGWKIGDKAKPGAARSRNALS